MHCRWRTLTFWGNSLTRTPSAAFLLAIAICFWSSEGMLAQVIHDNFDTGSFDKNVWAPCNRIENEITIVKDTGEDFFSAKMLVQPNPRIAAFSLMPKLRNCIGERPFDDQAERAEIWESNNIRLKFGSDVWYSFYMFIDGSVSPLERRLTIGQWKGPEDDSPMVAQRFQGHAFSITVEQPNNAPGHDKNDTQCRIVIAHDPNFPSQEEGNQPHFRELFEKTNRGGGVDLFIGSLGHDPSETVNTPEPCKTEIIIEPHEKLPEPFNRWTKMTYHLRIAGDANGYLNVWADDKPIVTVRGKIGFPARGTQYFKFGPYRDQNGLNSFYAKLAKFIRGPRMEDLR
jgi:hypothetical protein